MTKIKWFSVICKECGSEDVSLETEFEGEDCFAKLRCNDCGQEDFE